MAQKSREANKEKFQTGDIPSQGDYSDLIDSFAVLTNDQNSGSLTLTGSLVITGSEGITHITTLGGSNIFSLDSGSTFSIFDSGNGNRGFNLTNTNLTASGEISSSRSASVAELFVQNDLNVQGSITASNEITSSKITIDEISGGSPDGISFLSNITGSSTFTISSSEEINTKTVRLGNSSLNTESTLSDATLIFGGTGSVGFGDFKLRAGFLDFLTPFTSSFAETAGAFTFIIGSNAASSDINGARSKFWTIKSGGTTPFQASSTLFSVDITGSITASGNSLLGTDSENSHIFKGNITASDSGAGIISASGFIGSLTGTASNASLAVESTNVTVAANNTTDETVYLTFVDGTSGTQGIETDTSLTYNPGFGPSNAGKLQVDGQIHASSITASGNFIGNNIGPISDGFIPILPTDFNTPSNTLGTELTTNVLKGATILVSNTSPSLFNSYIIPNGMTATSCTFFGSGLKLAAYKNSIETSTSSEDLFTNGDATSVGATVNFTDFTGDGVTYITIQITFSSLSSTFAGGKINLT